MVNAGARPHTRHQVRPNPYSASASRSDSAASSAADGVTTTTITSQPRIVVVERSDRRTFAVSWPGPQSRVSGVPSAGVAAFSPSPG